MTPKQAYDIIVKLALGIDPETDAALLGAPVFENPMVVRALFMAKDAIKDLAASTVATRQPPPAPVRSASNRASWWREEPEAPATLESNAGKKWTKEDTAKVVQLRRAATEIQEIAVQLGRSDGAIISVLVKARLFVNAEEGHAANRMEKQARRLLPPPKP